MRPDHWNVAEPSIWELGQQVHLGQPITAPLCQKISFLFSRIVLHDVGFVVVTSFLCLLLK